MIEYSDVPAGAINIVTGRTAELAGVLAKHDDVDGLWVVADAETCAKAEAEFDRQSQARLDRQRPHARLGVREAVGGDVFLRRAIEVKNVWVPYGD